MLAALLHHGPVDAPLRRNMSHQRRRRQHLSLARLLQLHSQPHHLHDLQSRVSSGIYAHTMRRQTLATHAPQRQDAVDNDVGKSLKALSGKITM